MTDGIVGDEFASVFPTLAMRCPALTELAPSGWTAPHHLAQLPLFPQLRVLHIKFRRTPRWELLTAAEFTPLAEMRNLTELHLAQMDLSTGADDDTASLAVWTAAVTAMPLRTLHLSMVRLPKDALSALVQGAPALEDVRLLRVVAPPADVLPLCSLRRLHTLHVHFSLASSSPAVLSQLRYPSALLPSLRCLNWLPCVDGGLQYDHADAPVVTHERW
jgi:hypothetical protein